MNKWIEFFLGLVLVIVPVICALNWSSSWGAAAVHFLMGAVIVLVVLVGLLLIVLGISDIKG